MCAVSTNWKKIINRAVTAISEEQPVQIPFETGRLFIDHVGPLLLIHRTGRASVENLGTIHSDKHVSFLTTSYPSYLLTSNDPAHQEETLRIIHAITSGVVEQTGALLIIELWARQESDKSDDFDPFRRQPGFTIYLDENARGHAAIQTLCDELSGIEISGQGAKVDRVISDTPSPPGAAPLFLDTKKSEHITLLGLAINPIYINNVVREFYPGVLASLREELAPVFKCTAKTFAEHQGMPRFLPGRQNIEPASVAVDRGLAECGRTYSFLFQVTPINAAQAWKEFQLSNFKTPPELLYRPFTFDPDDLRRRLYTLPVDKIEDPIMAKLLREKREEMAMEIQMILDRETDQFLSGSLRLYGAPDADLIDLADNMLKHLSDQSTSGTGQYMDAVAIAKKVEDDFAYYRNLSPAFASSVEIRGDVLDGLMVTKGHVCIGKGTRIPLHRVLALISHEVGTHVVTYENGSAQPLHQLRDGLAGYETLQEGLAVLGEWLVGGLTASRLRILAARVIASAALVEGCSFVETFNRLYRRCELSKRTAFNVTVRTFRSGGLTKDIVYLKGLRELLKYLRKGGAFWPLFVGKIALNHLPFIEELLAHNILYEPLLRPRYASDPAVLKRLDRTRSGLSVLDLI